MKSRTFKKTLCSLGLIASVSGLCSFKAKEVDNNEEATLNTNLKYTNEGVLRISEEPTNQDLVNTFVNMIIEKGGEAITGGISVYAKTVVLNLLKECGLDFRDATTKSLEQIKNQLNIIETKVTAIAKKQETIHSEDILNNVLNPFAVANIRYMTYVSKSLAYLAALENDDTLTEEEIEKERIETYHTGIDKLLFDGATFATYVTTLAGYVLEPNKADPRKDIFYYYDNTMGEYDKWENQNYQNTKNFIAYLDGTLILLSNLAKFQMYYLSQNASEAMKRAYTDQIQEMANAVNAVNKLCADKLETKFKYTQCNIDNGLNVYKKTNEVYLTNMVPLTYNLNEKGWDSRQKLVIDYYNDTGKRGLLQVAYCYQPNQDIIRNVANDFKEFAGDYCTSSYTIQDYLKNAGFSAKHIDLFDKAEGLFMGDMYVNNHGFFYDDHDYSFSYIDKWGNQTRRNAYEVVSYHTWYGAVNRTELRANDTDYYLCFTRRTDWRVDGYLDGTYKKVYMDDVQFTVNNAVYYRCNYMDLYKQTGPIWVNSGW